MIICQEALVYYNKVYIPFFHIEYIKTVLLHFSLNNCSDSALDNIV